MNDLIEGFRSDKWTTIDGTFTLVSILITTLTLLVTTKTWWNNKKQLKPIKISFKIKSLDKKITIEDKITRRDTKRSEIQGIIRNKLIKGVNQYKINYLSTANYSENILKVQNVSENEVAIELEDHEISQFADFIIANLFDEELKKVEMILDKNNKLNILKKINYAL